MFIYERLIELSCNKTYNYNVGGVYCRSKLMRELLRRLFEGRYGSQGTDELTRFLLRLAIILLIVSLIIDPLSFLYYVAFIILICCYLRLFSKNTSKRYHENEIFKSYLRKLKGIFLKDK